MNKLIKYVVTDNNIYYAGNMNDDEIIDIYNQMGILNYEIHYSNLDINSFKKLIYFEKQLNEKNYNN